MAKPPTSRWARAVWTPIAAAVIAVMIASEFAGAVFQLHLAGGDFVQMVVSRSVLSLNRRPFRGIGPLPRWSFGPNDPADLAPRPLLPSLSRTSAATFVELPLWILAAIPTGLAIRSWWGAWRCDPTRCPSCCYDLTGLKAAVCPECGRQVKVPPGAPIDC